MARLFATPIDMAKLEILNLRLQNLSSAPSSPVSGQVYYDTSTSPGKFYGWNGSAWVDLGLTGGAGVATLTVDNSSIENIGTAADPSIRVKALGITNAMLAGSIAFTKLSTPAADFGWGGFKITNLADPVSGTDAANKQYVDAVAAGLAPKDAVRAATTANGTLASAFANGSIIDGVTLATGDRILLKNQSAGAENGIYTVNASGAPTRATDADSSGDLLGAAVFISEGTTNGNTLWVMTTDAPITVGTTALVWAQFGGPGEYTASNGITKTGIDFAIENSGVLTVTHGGTGGSTAAAAKTSLGFMTRFAQDVGNGSLTSITVTHNLGTKDVIVEVWDNTTPFAKIEPDIQHTSTNAITLVFATAPATNAYRCVVLG